MHESGDPHAPRGSLYASDFHLESFHKLLDGLSVPLLDIVDFDGIFDDVNGSTSSHIQGTAKSSSSVDLCLFDFDFQCPPSLVPLFDTRDNGDSLSLPLFTYQEQRVPPVKATSTVRTIPGVCPVRSVFSCAWRVIMSPCLEHSARLEALTPLLSSISQKFDLINDRQAAIDCNIKTFYGLNKKVTSVKNIRKLTKLDTKLNDALPNIEVDPETYAVTADDKRMTEHKFGWPKHYPTLQQSGFFPTTFRGFLQRHVAGERFPQRHVAGEYSSGIQSPAIIPREDVGPTPFSVKQFVPRWQTFPQRHVAGDSLG
ncbi:amidohydrolase 1 [Tanacetum coccineum]